MNVDIYDSLCSYLRENNLNLSKPMFRAVLSSLRKREEGSPAKKANSLAYALHLVEFGYTNDPKEMKKELADLSKKVWENRIKERIK